MEIQKQDFEARREELKRQRKGSRIISLILVLVFLAVSGGTGYLYAMTDGLNKDIAKTEEQIKEKASHIAEMLKDDTGKQLQASRNLEKVESMRTEWSKLAQSVLTLEMSDISFLQFSINPQTKKVNVSGTSKNYQSIVRFITDLKINPQVERPFISSVNESEKVNDVTTEVSFQLAFDLNLNPKKKSAEGPAPAKK